MKRFRLIAKPFGILASVVFGTVIADMTVQHVAEATVQQGVGPAAGAVVNDNVIRNEMPSQEHPARFASTVQLAIHEPNAALMKRAQNLVIQEFERNVQTVPELKAARMTVQKNGNEVVFSLLTNEDMRMPMRQVLMHMIDNLNGRVGARGRTSFYRTAFSTPPEAKYTVTVHDPEKRTVYIDAAQAPLIDLLQDMRRQMPSFSYIIPQECALRRVYWTFGNPDPGKHPEKLELKAAMQGIADMLQIKVDSANGAFAFSGDCRGTTTADMQDPRERDAEWGWPAEMLPMRWPPAAPRAPEVGTQRLPDAAVAVSVGRRTTRPMRETQVPVQVYFPVTPIDFGH